MYAFTITAWSIPYTSKCTTHKYYLPVTVSTVSTLSPTELLTTHKYYLPVTVSTVSTLSPPTELFTTHKYFPESSTFASLIIRVPETCFTLSSNWTACFLVVPSINLNHLKQKKDFRIFSATNYFTPVYEIWLDNNIYKPLSQKYCKVIQINLAV